MAFDYESFFKGDLIYIIDAMARRYGCLPTDILNLNLKDFSINQAIFLKAVLRENKEQEKSIRDMKRGKTTKPKINGNKLSLGEFQIEKKTK